MRIKKFTTTGTGVSIRQAPDNSSARGSGLSWSSNEYSELARRVVTLREDQIAGLLLAVGIRFRNEDIPEVVQDIKTEGGNAIHFRVLADEADSKDNLLWWLNYFEKLRGR